MSNTKLYPAWKEAINTFLKENFNPGDIISRKWLNEHFNIEELPGVTTRERVEKNHLEFLSAFSQFERTLLWEHQTALRNIRGVGYEIVPASEQTSWSVKEKYKGLKKVLNRAGERLINTNHALLNHNERRENTDALAKVAMLKGMVKEVKTLPESKLKHLMGAPPAD